MEVYNKAVSGEDFATLAVTYSDDPSAKGLLGGEGESANKGNKGDLGNFTVFNMVYPFENGAYNTAPGQISKPIRSTYYVDNADFVSCSLDSYVLKYDMLSSLKKGGTFLLNTTWSEAELSTELPAAMRRARQIETAAETAAPWPRTGCRRAT